MDLVERREGQSFEVGSASVSIADIRGNCVRLAVSAPVEVAVYRDELRCYTGELTNVRRKGGHGRLMLSRRVGEGIFVGDHQLIVRSVHRNVVTVGVYRH